MLKFNEVKTAIKTAYQAGIPLFVFGPPAIGKSASFKEATDDLGILFLDYRLTTKEPIDLRGLPDLAGEYTKYRTPDEYPKDRGSRGIMLLDEISAVSPEMQVAAQQLIQERKIGSYTFPDGWIIMGAGNRASDRAGSSRLLTTVYSRVCSLEMAADPDQWLAWYISQSDFPDSIACFIEFMPECLYQFDPKSAENSFPSPRTWEMVAKLLRNGMPKSVKMDMISGLLGSGVAAQFLAFEKIYEGLPNPKGILLNPDSADVPADPSTLAATVSALARMASAVSFGSILRYLARCPKEMEFLGVKLATRFNKELHNTRDFSSWFVHNQRFILPA